LAFVSFISCKETYIAEWYPNTNFSSSTALFVSQYKQTGDDYRSLIQFDICHLCNMLPPVSTVEKAELELYMYRNEAPVEGIVVYVNRILNSWNCDTVSWNYQPPISTDTDGAVFVTNTTPLSTIKIDIIDLVQGWFEGIIPNNGVLISGNEQINSLLGFINHNYPDSSKWPRLNITYVNGYLNKHALEHITIPGYPDYPIINSSPVSLGPRKQATFLVENTCSADCLFAKIQIGHSNAPDATFSDAGPWLKLKPLGYPGEAIALTTYDAAEYARVLIMGAGGETLNVYPRTREY